MNDILKTLKMIDAVESKKPLTESTVAECSDMGGTVAAPATNPGNPVTASITLNASGMEHVSDLMKLIQNAGLQPQGPAPAPTMPVRMDMERLCDKMSGLEMESDAAYSKVINDDMEIDESANPKELMGQIRKAAKGVETSPDEQAHLVFAQQIEPRLIELFQIFDQQQERQKKAAVQQLIQQNKLAQKTTNRRNANDIVSVLWDLMNQNESWDNEPEEEYQDHNYMINDLAGGINKPKKMYKPAAGGDNPMAVENFKTPSEGEYYDDEEQLSIRWMHDNERDDIDLEAYDSEENMVTLSPRQEDYYKDLIKQDIQDQHDDYGDHKMRLARDESVQESIKDRLYKALSEKKAKPDFLDVDGDGDKKEPMKKAIADKKKITTEGSKIKIVSATKYSDGKVAVKYSYKTSFGEERTNVVVGAQSYVEKKLKSLGWKDWFIDYKPPTS